VVSSRHGSETLVYLDLIISGSVPLYLDHYFHSSVLMYFFLLVAGLN